MGGKMPREYHRQYQRYRESLLLMDDELAFLRTESDDG